MTDPVLLFQLYRIWLKVWAVLPEWGFLIGSSGFALFILLRWRPRKHELLFGWRIALSHLRSRRRDKGVSAITLISVAGVTVGVMALVIVLSVMAGFEIDMRDKILGSNAHIVVLHYGMGMPDSEEITQQVESIPGVVAAAPFVYSEMMVRSTFASTGAIIKGIDPVRTARVTDLKRNLVTGPAGNFENDEQKEALLSKLSTPPAADTQDISDTDMIPGVIIGQEMADQLKVFVGDKIHVINPLGGGSGPLGTPVPKVKAFRIAAIFYSGMYEYDTKWLYITNGDAQEFLDQPGRITGIEARVSDIYDVDAISLAIENQLHYPYYTRHWKNLNVKLFSALKLEKIVMGLILSLIVMVASLNIVGTLILVVLTRGREISILRAMGASATAVRSVFMVEGVFIGIVGTLIGTVLGLIGCFALDRYRFPLDSDVYYLDSLPVVIEPLTILFLMYTAVMICFYATLYPASQAARLDPVEGLRYE